MDIGIPIQEKDREKTGFATRQGLWQWHYMPMGLKNSSFTFQRAMQSVLQKHLWKHCMVYVDDIIIYSETIEEHMDMSSHQKESCRPPRLTEKNYSRAPPMPFSVWNHRRVQL